MKRRKQKSLSCQGLVNIAEGFMNEEYIPYVGFSGTIDNLQVPPNWKVTTEGMPVDMIVNLAKDGSSNNGGDNTTSNN
eukprot:14663534-Ditylum_brightwellii.AAC.1